MVLLGDGEFDGTTLQETLNEAAGAMCRTAQSTVVTWTVRPSASIPWERSARDPDCVQGGEDYP